MAWAGRGWWALKAAVGVTPVLVTLEDWVLTVVPCRDTLMQVSVPHCPLEDSRTLPPRPPPFPGCSLWARASHRTHPCTLPLSGVYG